jgi:RNA polymerase sigma factor (sigma-70 family)
LARRHSAPARGSAAFAKLYRQHFEGLYDFVVRIVRDHDLAGEIVQTTFSKAWNELSAGRKLDHPKAWLYAVARNHALDELRRRRRLTDEPLAYAQADPSRLSDPQAVAEDNELVELVWSSAAALTPEEYSLLDLHVRHGFSAADLAQALNLERGAVYTRLSRLRNSLADSVASTLLVRRGRRDCSGLAGIVAEHGGGNPMTPELRRAVHAHVEVCETCGTTRRRVVSPVALFGSLVPIVPLAGARDAIFRAILPAGTAPPPGPGPGPGNGNAAAAARHGARTRLFVAGAGGLAATAAVLGLLYGGGSSARDPSRGTTIDYAALVSSPDPTVITAATASASQTPVKAPTKDARHRHAHVARRSAVAPAAVVSLPAAGTNVAVTAPAVTPAATPTEPRTYSPAPAPRRPAPGNKRTAKPRPHPAPTPVTKPAAPAPTPVVPPPPPVSAPVAQTPPAANGDNEADGQGDEGNEGQGPGGDGGGHDGGGHGDGNGGGDGGGGGNGD